MQSPKDAVRTFVRSGEVLLAKQRLSGLRRAGAVCERIANAMEASFRSECTLEERDWIQRIEAIRDRLLSSAETVTLVDFGARDGAVELPSSDMEKGVEIPKALNQVARASKDRFWAFLLFRLLREFQPVQCLELGTCVGVSASYHAAALKLNGSGSIVTLEGSPSLLDYARSHFDELGLDNVEAVAGRFMDTLPEVLERHGPFDYAFVDGHHAEQATIDYFNMITPYLKPFALIVFDDISWSPGMKRAWRNILTHPKVKIAVDLRTVGVCVLDEASEERRQFHIPIH